MRHSSGNLRPTSSSSTAFVNNNNNSGSNSYLPQAQRSHSVSGNQIFTSNDAVYDEQHGIAMESGNTTTESTDISSSSGRKIAEVSTRLPLSMIDDDINDGSEVGEIQALNIRMQHQRGSIHQNDALMEDLDDIMESPSYKTESGDIWERSTNITTAKCTTNEINSLSGLNHGLNER